MGSNPIPGATTPSPTFTDYLVRERRLAQSTVETRDKIVRSLGRKLNLWDLKAVEDYIFDSKVTNGRKEVVSQAYSDWCRWKGFEYKSRKFSREEKLPYIPREQEIDQLIASSGFKLACFLQVLKETGCRPVEAWRIKIADLSLESKTLYINSPAKNSRPRVFHISNKLVSMLSRLSATSTGGKLWKSSQHTIQRDYQRTRKLLSQRLGDPELNKISMKTFRHWKATMEYHRTKDILFVQRILGHKSLKNTLVYTHLLENSPEEEYIVKVASTVEEFTSLLESGFEYVSDYEGKKILKMRK